MGVVRVPEAEWIEQAEWINQAACKGVDATLFFPERGESTVHAKRVCGKCPVVEECYAFCLRSKEAKDWGIWGGTSAKERQKKRRIRLRRSFEIQHGLIYIYTNGMISRVVHDSTELRADLIANGYERINKNE